MARLYLLDWLAGAAWMPWLSASRGLQLWRPLPGVWQAMSALPPNASAALAKLSEQEARSLLLCLGAVAALRAYDRDCAERYAAQLLAQHCTRAIIRDRLKHRFNISERTAYRHIDAVIQSISSAKTCLVMAGDGRIFHTPQP